MAGGIKVFSSLAEAKAAGFLPFEKTPTGYLVRRDDGHAFALAVVKLEDTPEPARAEDDAPADASEAESTGQTTALSRRW
jgi:hypothetical protein